MFSFGRKRFDDPGAEFWKWWPDARDGIAKAIVSGAFDDRIVNDITKHVHRVHSQMAWELQPGSQASHAFCLSTEGNPELRQVALCWLERAPAPDASWEYHPSKQRMGDRAVLAARVTVPGNRTWHFVSLDFDKMRPAIDGWAEWLPDSLSPGLPQRRLKIHGGQDMTWQFQRDLGIR